MPSLCTKTELKENKYYHATKKGNTGYNKNIISYTHYVQIDATFNNNINENLALATVYEMVLFTCHNDEHYLIDVICLMGL